MEKVTLDQGFLLKELKKIRTFQYLSDQERTKLLSICEVLEYIAGEEIVSEGEIEPFFYGILNGSVNIVVNNDKNQEVVVGTLVCGELFGEAAIFTNVKRTANIVAVEKTQVIQIDRDKFFQFIKNAPQAGIKILMLMIYALLQKLKDTNKELALERHTVFNEAEVDEMIKCYLD